MTCTGCLLAVGARRARGSNKFSSVSGLHPAYRLAMELKVEKRRTLQHSTF